MHNLHEQDAGVDGGTTSADWLGRDWKNGQVAEIASGEGLGGELQNLSLHQFEPIAERVEDMHAAESIEGYIGFCGETLAFACGYDLIESIDDECRMCAFCRIKIGLDAEVQVH